MHFTTSLACLLILAGSAAASPRFQQKRQGCDSQDLDVVQTINRGSEGIWYVGANQTGLTLLHQYEQLDWLDNNHTAVDAACGSMCLQGNDTASPGAWLPSGDLFQGALVNTPGGTGDESWLWRCQCWTAPIAQNNLVSGAGAQNGVNPGSGTIINRKC